MASRDVERLLQCCAKIYQWDETATFAQHASRVLVELIDCSVAVYQSVNASPEDEMALSRPAPEIQAYADLFAALAHEHPLINHQRRTNDERALRITDVADMAAYRRTALFNEFYRTVDLPHQLAVGLSSKPGEVIGLVASRDGQDFTDLECRLLDLFRTHVVQAREQAMRYRRTVTKSRQLRGTIESLREGIVSLDRHLRERLRTKRAAALLATHFPSHTPHTTTALPERVRSWVARESAYAFDRSSHAPRRRTLMKTDAGSLKLELVAVEEGWTLVLEERSIRWESAALESLGLTSREAEVLLWICQGKSNPEIAIILGAGPRTVEKHVERILRKLEVESRGAAALRAMEMLF